MISGVQTSAAQSAYPAHLAQMAKDSPPKDSYSVSASEPSTPAPSTSPAPDLGAKGRVMQASYSAHGDMSFADFAEKYDVRAMTPKQIDAFVDAMPFDGPDTINLLILKTYGAEFQTHITQSLREAGITDVSDAELEARLEKPIDLIAATELNIAYNRLSGGPTEAAEEFLDWLQDRERSD